MKVFGPRSSLSQIVAPFLCCEGPLIHVNGQLSLYTQVPYDPYPHSTEPWARSMHICSTDHPQVYGSRAPCSSTHTKTGTTQRRLAYPLHKDDMQICEALRI